MENLYTTKNGKGKIVVFESETECKDFEAAVERERTISANRVNDLRKIRDEYKKLSGKLLTHDKEHEEGFWKCIGHIIVAKIVTKLV